MTILIIILVTAVFIQGVLPLLLTRQLSSRVRRKLKEDFPAEFAPPLTIILPCKGIDFGFEENMISILNQDYPFFEIIFVTADDDDPAYGILKRLMEEHKSARASLITAGTSNKRSQKLNNQLAALKKISPSSEALVFLDSDVRAEKDFLRQLVRPLQDKTIGVSTGYRWYLPVRGRLGAMVRSIWNAGALPLLIHPRYNFAFGGTMAIRREVFEEAGVAKAWEGALTDDFPLSLAVKKRGYTVRFVPHA